MHDEELQDALLTRWGGTIFSAHTDHIPICHVCRRPLADERYTRCYQCHQAHKDYPALKESEHGFMFYALSAQQSHWMMRHYKGQDTFRPQQRQNALTILHHYLYLAFSRHLECLEKRGLPAFDAWTLIPSISKTRFHTSHDHPLFTLVHSVLERCNTPLPHLELVSQPTSEHEQREVSKEHFSLKSHSGRFRHILVIDDTWVSGGHMFSAAALVNQQLDTQISTLSLARYIDCTYPASQGLLTRIEEGHIGSYQPLNHCIWTPEGICPTATTESGYFSH